MGYEKLLMDAELAVEPKKKAITIPTWAVYLYMIVTSAAILLICILLLLHSTDKVWHMTIF